ncbi:unnamed protein product [Arctia plantaginis]|uniref:CRAL-TRIO domain-containing protein n=1 Tax=Arctia plantaginis TaxID=874455 RepID=A0A8S1ALQ4_ARCPL|nr:unnamed protein product [Arctia plantaginis]
MEEINPNSMLKFNENHLQKVREALGYGDVNKLKQDIKHLADWIKMQNHFRVKEFDEGYLERLLIYNKGSIERTKQKFDKLCTCINLMPEFLQNFDIKNEFKPLFNIITIAVLPKPTNDNYRVVISDFIGKDDNDFNIIQLYRYLMVMGHYMLSNDYCHGYEWIAGTKNLTMSTITKMNPMVIHKGLTLFTDAMGQRLKKIHIISGSKFFDAFMMVCKQALSAKLRERLVIHPDVESLYKDFPREQFPKDFGGDEKSIQELQEINFKQFSSDSHIETVKFMEKAATDESFRQSCKFNEEYSGMPGSFKTLCVD